MALDKTAVPSPPAASTFGGFIRLESPVVELLKLVDWAGSPLGEPAQWCDTLRTTLALILDTPQSMYLVWGKGRTFLFNDAYVPILGPRLPRAMGARFEELWYDAWPVVESAFLKAEAGEHSSFENLPIPMERYGVPEKTWWTFSFSSIRDPNGDVVGVLCSTVETTALITSHQESLAQERRNRQILDSTSDFAIVATDLDAKVTLWSKGAERVLGWSEEEMLGQTMGRLLAASDHTARQPYPEKPQAHVDDIQNEERWYLSKSGERLWAQGEKRLLRNIENAPVGHVQVFRDRTIERMRQHRLSLLAEASAGILTAENPETIIAPILQAGTEALGFEQAYYYVLTTDREHLRLTSSIGVDEEIRASLQHAPFDLPLCGIVAETCKPLIVSGLQASTDPRMDVAKRVGLRAYAGFPVTGRDGLYGVISFGSVTVNSFNEEALDFFSTLARFLSIGRERLDSDTSLRELAVTLENRVDERTRELMIAEEALRHSQKMEAIGQLTGGVAHDFNNLLTVISGSVDLLRKDNVSPERRSKYLEAIGETADRAAKLTSQLLSFARRQTLKPEIFDVAERLRAVLDMLDTVTGGRIKLAQLIEDRQCFAKADISQFETALVNMAVNARDAMDGEGTLTLGMRRINQMPAIRAHIANQGPFVAISVADNGAGIPADKLARIFEPFFTTKEIGKGTGLGLSQVFGFAKQSGGNVEVESELGKGSVFTLYLPAVSNPQLAGEHADHPPAALSVQGLRILVAEDNVEVGRFCMEALTDMGLIPTWVTSAEDALLKLQPDGRHFDVVFSDVVMPGMGGFELAKKLRREMPALPVILASGYSHVLAREGTQGFELLHKPYSADQLSQAIQIAVSQAQQAAQAT